MSEDSINILLRHYKTWQSLDLEKSLYRTIYVPLSLLLVCLVISLNNGLT